LFPKRLSTHRQDRGTGDGSQKLQEFGLPEEKEVSVSYQVAVFPFVKFPGVDPILSRRCIQPVSDGHR